MNRRLAALTAGTVLTLLSACAPAPADNAMAGTTAGGSTSAAGSLAATDPAEARRTIEAANASAMAGMLANDVTAATANYAENAVVMMPAMATMRGRAAVQEGFKGMMSATPISAAKFTTEDVIASGDLAVETGTYTMTVTPKGAKPIDDNGKYMSVWRKQADGTWKVEREINHSDIPPK